MSKKERDELEKDSNKLGCIVGFIFLIVKLIGIILKGLFSDD